MKLFSRQLPSGKWGIYSGDRLLATIGCQATCETIMANLSSGRRDAPVADTNALYQAPKLRSATATSSAVAVSERLADRQLAAELKAKEQRVKELEEAVFKAQKLQGVASKAAAPMANAAVKV